MDDVLKIKVTKVGRRYHARLFLNGKLNSEMACQRKQDIGYICRELLRWYDKCSAHHNKYASSSRDRQRSVPMPLGRIWWPTKLPATR